MKFLLMCRNSVGAYCIRRRPCTKVSLSLIAFLALALFLSALSAPANAATSHQTIIPSVLRVSPSDLPRDFASFSGTSLTASDADRPTHNIFAGLSFHTLTYTSAGMQGGYFQHTRLSSGADIYWLGTSYAGADGASQMLADATSTLETEHFDAMPCHLADAPGCRLYIFPRFDPGGLQDFLYAVWARGTVLGEALISAAYYTMSWSHTDIGIDLHALLAAADATVTAAVPTGVPAGSPPDITQPAITVDSMSILHIARGQLVQTTSLHLHETGLFLATFHLSGIGTYSPSGDLTAYFPKARMTLLKGDQTIYSGGADFEQQQDGTPFFDQAGSLERSTAIGALQARFTVSLGPSSDAKLMPLKVTAAKKKASERAAALVP